LLRATGMSSRLVTKLLVDEKEEEASRNH
jgi:hypothetical protein